MKVVYETILDKIEDIKEEADRNNAHIKHIILNDAEMRQFDAEMKVLLGTAYRFWADCRMYYGVKILLGD